MLIDVQKYKATWAIGGTSAMPKELDFPSSTAGKWEDGRMSWMSRLTWTLRTVHKSALGKVSLPPKARFVPGKAMHV